MELLNCGNKIVFVVEMFTFNLCSTDTSDRMCVWHDTDTCDYVQLCHCF